MQHPCLKGKTLILNLELTPTHRTVPHGPMANGRWQVQCGRRSADYSAVVEVVVVVVVVYLMASLVLSTSDLSEEVR